MAKRFALLVHPCSRDIGARAEYGMRPCYGRGARADTPTPPAAGYNCAGLRIKRYLSRAGFGDLFIYSQCERLTDRRLGRLGMGADGAALIR